VQADTEIDIGPSREALRSPYPIKDSSFVVVFQLRIVTLG
jgi:hypothetical protein